MNNQNLKTLPSQTDEIASPNAFRGSIAERRAAKCGFNADRINTARFRTTTSLTVPSPAAVRSPCITIPPGISPTALLDSPILLPNSQPSPTTGTFLIPDHGSSFLNSVTPSEQERGNNVSSSFRLKPHGDPSPLLNFPPWDNQGNSDLQVLVPVEQSMDFEFPAEFSKEAAVRRCTGDSITDVNLQNSMIFSANFGGMQMCCSDVASNQSSVQRDPINGDKAGIHDAVEENKVTFPATANGRTSEDGYNWRKYGQKQVKGSEYPRSYYKCTHPTCQVKKKIERSHDGQITEIIYKGAHNHLKPQPSRRVQLGSGSSFGEMPEKDEGSGTCVRVEHGSLWRNTELESKEIKHSSEWRADGMERTSSTSVVTELSDPLSTTQGKSVGTFESAETPELSSTLASHDDDDEDDKATQGSISLRADDDESESKRRKVESYMVETNLASRAIREPRVVVQIESEIDILDDGYRWRKYGQKVVKGNPNPRSYYKCTSAGCSVRKHVERASHNLKYVITTYEGKHNHEVPAARNSTNVNSSSNILSQATANAQPSLALARNCGPKLETQLQDFTPGFDRKPIFHNDYLGARFPVNFTGEVKLGTSSSIYPVKYPSIQRAVSYGCYGFDSNHSATHLSGSAASLVPDFQISLPLSLPTTANHSLAGVGFSNNGSLIGQVQTFLSGQQFIRPKEEQKDDHLYDSGLSIINHANPSSSSTSLYHHIRGNFPS